MENELNQLETLRVINACTVELSRELDLQSQEQAEGLFSYEEDHGTILESKPVFAQIQRLISSE